MKIRNAPLTVFPTELAKRRTERRLAPEYGVLDTSRLFTQKKLMNLCERAARLAGLLKGRQPGPAEQRLLLEEAAEAVHFAPGQTLARLSSSARTDLLNQIIGSFAVFAENEPSLTAWLLAHETNHKLHGFGELLTAWRALCTRKEIADRFTVNAALLRLIQSGTLPHELKNGLHFRAVRWFNPFEERFAAALTLRLGPERINISSVLPGAHAEAAEDRLSALLRSDTGEAWEPWLEDFADAFGADDGNILEDDSRRRVSFFLSAHPYGEIEDAARRIAREIETGTAPDEIALILRDLSPCTDIVPDVFRRFGIPYHFRRGTPAAACPPVKTLLALLSFPQTRSRDRLCDLLLMPGIAWPGLDLETRLTLVQEIRRKEPPRLRRLPKKLTPFFQPLENQMPPAEYAKQIQNLIGRHKLILPPDVLELINDIGITETPPAPPERMLSLFEKLLDNITLKDELSTENGVWIVNPMDAAGLRFQSVFIAGMDDRNFPQLPRADSLLNADERNAFKKFLTERKIPCPRLALSETGTTLIQEEILFLTAISTACERLTLSCARTDSDGKELSPGEFFERMRGLTRTEQPARGDSFHTILPPEACRAEDEVRQTMAFESRTGFQPVFPCKEPIDRRQDGSLSYIQRWLENHPEFSATALESLARNRFVFFLEKMLGIKPDITHEDDIHPMDRGIIIHDILEQVYTVIAKQSGLYAAQCEADIPPASNDRDGCPTFWKIARSGEIPLAVFDPARAEDLLALARETAEEVFRKTEQQTRLHLGHPAIRETEKRRLLQIVGNFIRMDIETAQAENRYPALFEMKFDANHDLPVTLRRGEETIRLKGKIDRIDLIFDSNGRLDRLLVIDYKSKSQKDSADHLEKKIALNLDCQLPLYSFAAQQKFFGNHNTPELNKKTQAVYHLQECDLKEMTNHFQKRRLTMAPELSAIFLETLFSNVGKLREGDLAPEPLIAGYEDCSHICRTAAIDPKELLRSER
ncbi:MAG: PD-(D/E)XK nuclease family protein [Pontiellaceae bacterium]|jgi:RecB family exonuclease|nr:PD-(D/E)XK nuclease family protein [Pontiellaceae bacterium]